MVTPDLVDLQQSPQEDQKWPPEPELKIREMVLVREKTLRRGSENKRTHLPRGVNNVKHIAKSSAYWLHTLSSAIRWILPTSSAAGEYTSERKPVTDLADRNPREFTESRVSCNVVHPCSVNMLIIKNAMGIYFITGGIKESEKRWIKISSHGYLY